MTTTASRATVADIPAAKSLGGSSWNAGGFQWRGETVALNPFGAKVRLETKAPGPEAGSLVRLHFSPPDGKPAMTLKGLVWRVDAGDAVVVFSNLSSKEFLRLKYLTDRVLGTQPAALSGLRPAR